MKARVAVIQFPGVNCEAETTRALERVGLEAETFRWTRPAAELAGFEAYVLPGGFSYQDRVRAGALAAKDPLVEVLAEQAERGVPVLGICNGAQVLVEAGLVPGGGGVELALARNRMPARSGYHARWIYVRTEASPCLFTSTLEPGAVLPLPVAHGEGRFTARAEGRVGELAAAGQTPLRYSTADGRLAAAFPDNPNGSEDAVAAVCNARGNVLALMPHPERAQDLGALSRAVGGTWGARRDALLETPRGASGRGDDAGREDAGWDGPGLAIFAGLARHLSVGGQS
jgi:phosphoribosylformylglycinamidine synthase